MFFSHGAKPMCNACHSLFRWLMGLSLIVIGVLGLLVQLGVFVTRSPWGWTWPVLAIVWGLVVLYNVGCKECGK